MTIDVLERLEILRMKLEDEGWYVKANTVSLAMDEITKLRKQAQPLDPVIRRPHPAHDEGYLAWLAARKEHHKGCEIGMCGSCTCFNWAYDDYQEHARATFEASLQGRSSA